MSTETMVYVAADPQQPGAAWAAFVDCPTDPASLRKSMAKEIASWVRKGAEVKRVTPEEARAMLSLWKRPAKPSRKPAPDLFAALEPKP